jgi:hypothetical protein
MAVEARPLACDPRALWWALYPEDVYAFLAGKTPISDVLISPIVPTIPFFIMVLVANFIPDYISLLTTRAILRWMNRQQSLLAVCALGALGLVASVAIVVVSAPVAWQLTVAIYFGPTPLQAPTSYWANLLHSVQRGVVNLPRQLWEGLIYELFSLRVGDCLAVCVPWGIWTYASLFTSVWLWLYGAAGVAVKLLYYVGGTVTRLRELFDVDAKPITSIGFVAMILVSIVFWVWRLVMALR